MKLHRKIRRIIMMKIMKKRKKRRKTVQQEQRIKGEPRCDAFRTLACHVLSSRLAFYMLYSFCTFVLDFMTHLYKAVFYYMMLLLLTVSFRKYFVMHIHVRAMSCDWSTDVYGFSYTQQCGSTEYYHELDQDMHLVLGQ
ncbi:hypothetical protein GDO81_007578 [Engystomops pustulosus]|uniref:Uncharacterized protein n=1 Tax=Engystomops pustulosus TaxID=76066 RepID=A0AAV7C9X7_ENGPU|nr:hypothetical protein GDO81_007578 [Engystomops pustulosus]